MSFMSRIKAAFTRKSTSTTSSKAFSTWFVPRGSMFSNRSESALVTSEIIFAAVSRLANSVSSLPIKVNKSYAPVESSFSHLLTYQPNNNMTTTAFISLLETHRNIYGNAYAMLEYDNRAQIKALNVLDPNRVEPVIDSETKEVYYQVMGDSGTTYVHNTSIIHLKHVGHSGIKGVSPIRVLQGTLDFDAGVREFSLVQMDGAKASFILKLETNVSDEKKMEMLQSFGQFYRDNGGVLIEEAGTKIERLDSKFIDSKVFDVDKVTRARVASVFTLPLYMIGEGTGQVSTSSMEQHYLDYVQGTLTPIVTQYEAEFNRKLLTEKERKSGIYFKFNLNALQRADMQARGAFYQQGIRSGWFKPNEVRAWEDLPPVDGGDQLFLSKDLFPIDQVAAQRIGGADAPTAPTLSEGGENN
ncbi:phage portal protein [Bacillus safensis]|nr:phage portal protein [Bacillus safensis]